MEKVILNSDMLNIEDSVFYQINHFEFERFVYDGKSNIIQFLVNCHKHQLDKGRKPESIFMSIAMYGIIRKYIEDQPHIVLFSVEEVLSAHNITSKLVVFIPDSLKDKFKPIA